ncbi:MAG: hybrid sensor histidine kinase/response regulator [Pseudomarimonas sp.]
MSDNFLTTKAMLALIIDDQEANLRLIGTLLTAAGFDVMPAMSAEQALTRLAATLPDVILLDMRMPGKDGFWLLQQLKSNQQTADVPVLFLTAAHEREYVTRAIEEGAVDYVTKPFVAEELIARVRAHAEAKQLRDRLRRAIIEREEISALVAHDLKNPLFNISLNASMLSEVSSQPEQVIRIAASIEKSAQRAMTFVQHYLENRADIELRRGFQPTACDPLAVITELIEALAPTLASKRQQILCDQKLIAHVLADEQSLRVVLRNLFTNASKYSPADTDITVSLRRGKPGSLQMAVLDCGPGVSCADQTRLFQRFVRLGSRAEGGETSSGLGLASAMQEARWMGGELWYEDAAGGGAAFILELPLAGEG